MNPEVKNVIIQNIMRGTVNILPVSLEINELNVNILADIAMCHKSDVISSLQGETISIATRRKLSKGNKIKIGRNYFTLQPVASKLRIEKHRNYLKKRKVSASLDANTELIESRLKMLNNDKLLLRIGLIHLEKKEFMEDLEKITYFLKHGSSGISCVRNIDLFSNFCDFIPTAAALRLVFSIRSFCKTIYNTGGAIIIN